MDELAYPRGRRMQSTFMCLSDDKFNQYVYNIRIHVCILKMRRYDIVALVTGEIEAIISDGETLARIK